MCAGTRGYDKADTRRSTNFHRKTLLMGDWFRSVLAHRAFTIFIPTSGC